MSGAIILTPRRHETFDVLEDGKAIGSVWRFHDGWAAYTERLTMIGGLFATAELAARHLADSPRLRLIEDPSPPVDPSPPSWLAPGEAGPPAPHNWP